HPAVVVVLDGAQRLRSMPGVTRILTQGPALGVYALCVEDDERLLPEECDTVVEVTSEVSLTVRRHRLDPLTDVLPDWVDADWLDLAGRAVYPVEASSPDGDKAAISETRRLHEVLGAEPPTPDAVAARWVIKPRSNRAVVGESLDGAFSVD